MAYQGISTGTTPNDNTGDSLLTGAIKINSNFTEIYSALGDGTVINLNPKVGFSTIITVPDSTTAGLSPNFNNALFILEGPSSILSVNSTFPVGTRLTVVSKNSTNVINRPTGTKIMGLEENLSLDSNYSSFDIIWTGSAFGWAIK